MEVQKVIIDSTVQYLVTGALAFIATGLVTVVTLALTQRRDVKKLLQVNQLLADNIGSLIPCSRDTIKSVRSTIYAVKETVKDDDEAAMQSIENAMEFIGRAEDQLNCRSDKNAGAAMAVGG